MRYHLNGGYGAVSASGLPFLGTGKVFIVGDSSTVNIGNLKELFIPDPDGKIRFYSTIDAAVGACTTDAGDVIYVMPGHTETITGAGGITFDVSGVTCIGLGSGTLRPTVSFTTAAAVSIDIDAVNVTVKNLIFDMTGVDTIVAGIDVNYDDFTMDGCKIIQSSDTDTAVICILSDTNVDRVSILNTEIVGDTSTGGASAIKLIGGEDHLIKGCRITGDYSVATIEVATTASLRLNIEDNYICNNNGVDINIKCVASTTGQISRNNLSIPTTGEVTWVSPGNCMMFDNYGANAVTKSAINPVGDSSVS